MASAPCLDGPIRASNIPRAPFRLHWVSRSYTGHPETSLRQAASAVFLRIAAAPTSAATGLGVPFPSSRAASAVEAKVAFCPSQRCACFGDHTSARVVLWALAVVRSSSPQDQRLDCGTDQTVRADETNGDGGGGSGDGGGKGLAAAAAPSWQSREGALLVYEGVLKHLVESRFLMGWTVSDGLDRPCSTTARDGNGGDDGEGCRGEWPAELLRATPSLGQLLVSLLSEAGDALYEAELMRSTGSHPQRQPRDGSLELWRTGSQLLSTIGRAMVWWNPRAIFQ